MNAAYKVRARRLMQACLVTVLLASCFTAKTRDNDGDDDECDTNDDCAEDEECRSGNCRSIDGGGGIGGIGGTGGSTGGSSSCSALCDRATSECEPSTGCVSSCTTLVTIPGCTAQGSAWLSCVARASTVCEPPPECAAQTTSLMDCLTNYCINNPSDPLCGGGGECPFTNDGECDEPEGLGFCPEGSDAADCVPCPYTNDGVCDEGIRCSVGLDDADCDGGGGSCPFTNDGDCDEPEGLGFCPEGSDVADCIPCPYTNDGVCDEGTRCSYGLDDADCDGDGSCVPGSPGNTCVWACDSECDHAQGTGVCSEGTDTYDCTFF